MQRCHTLPVSSHILLANITEANQERIPVCFWGFYLPHRKLVLRKKTFIWSLQISTLTSTLCQHIRNVSLTEIDGRQYIILRRCFCRSGYTVLNVTTRYV